RETTRPACAPRRRSSHASMCWVLSGLHSLRRPRADRCRNNGLFRVKIDMEKDSKMKLGLITYNVAKDWDLPTIIDHVKKAGWDGVELRTTHAHGVELTLNAEA